MARSAFVWLALLLSLSSSPPARAQLVPGPARPELVESGQRKKVAGIALIGAGAALNLAGFAVTVVNVVSIIINIHNKTATPDEFLRGTPGSIVGTVLTATGYVAIASGVVTYIVGGRQMKRAQQLTAGISPVLGFGGGGAALQLGARW